MKFSLFITLLDFMPDRIYLYSKGELIGDREIKWFFGNGDEVKNMEVEIIEINRGTSKIELEVIKWKKVEKELLVELLNKAIKSDCLLIDGGLSYISIDNYVAVIDKDKYIIMMEY